MRVAILGCGYVGLELGRQLADEHEVFGVRRSDAGIDAVERAGLQAVRADVTDPAQLADVPDADAVVFAVSADGRDAAAYRAAYVEGQRTAIESLAGRADPPERYIYTSSTGVYGDHDGDWVDEETELRPTSERTELLARAETLALEATADAGIDGTVARLAGIYGPDRYGIERYLESPVVEGHRNAIHRDDAAGVLAYLLEEDLARGEVVLVVDDEPVSRVAFAEWLAAATDRSPPETLTRDTVAADDARSESARRRLTADKRCSNDRLRDLGYEFRYPTFREGYRQVLDGNER
jgi:nucleoside-diphosphate-sugar epimerase